MPLVRYRTGDFVRVPREWTERELTEVSYGTRAFAGVIGRENDVLLTPDGVQLNGLGIMARGIQNVVRFQLIQLNRQPLGFRNQRFRLVVLCEKLVASIELAAHRAQRDDRL